MHACRRDTTSEKLQPVLAQLAFILNQLRSLLDDERSIAIWLRAPHPDLGGLTPLALILDGRSAAVLRLLHIAESGQTT